MKPRYKMAFGMFSLVVLAGATSAAIFYFQGSQIAVYAQVAVVPLLIVVGYLWVNRTVQAVGTSRTEFEHRKARQLGETFSELWERAREMETRHGASITDSEWEKLERQSTDLRSNGVKFDTSTGTFKISSRNLGSLEDINRLQGELEALEQELLTAYTQNVRNRIREVNELLARLDELVIETKVFDPSSVPDVSVYADDGTQSWDEVADMLDNCYQIATEVIEESCAVVQEALVNTDDDVDGRVEETLSNARKAIAANQYEEAIVSVLNARDMVERDAAASFDDQREALRKLLSTASNKPFDTYLGSSYHEQIDEHQRQLNSIDEAIEIAEVRALREEIQETCLHIVTDLETEAQNAVQTLEEVDVPASWYDPPATTSIQHASSLQNCRDVTEFNSTFDMAVEELLQVLESVKPKASVAKAFDRIEARITDALRSEGEITGADLPVSELEEQFLDLYYRKHMHEVTFDRDEPRLESVYTSETYSVHVTVTFPEGGKEREVAITLTGQDTWSDVCHTALVAETTFEEIPYGEYTIHVDPAGDSYAPTKQAVTIDGDKEIDIELQRLSLREQLCTDIDIDTDRILSNLSSRFEGQFEKEGYLSTEMQFPVDNEYIPCLIAVWAEQEGHSVTRDGTKIIVYDTEKLQKEVENIIRYNLEVGDSKTYEELRSNFLSAPISDSAVQRLVRNSSERDAVVCDEHRLTKEAS